MVVDLIFLNTEVSLSQALEDVSRGGSPFAIVITQQHQIHRSCTVNIMFGTPQGTEAQVGGNPRGGHAAIHYVMPYSEAAGSGQMTCISAHTVGPLDKCTGGDLHSHLFVWYYFNG